MISIQRVHFYLNLPTYSYDRIFNDRFCPMKTPITWFKTQLQIYRHTVFQSRTNHTHESRNSTQGSNACIVFMGVMLLSMHVLLSTYANFRLFAFPLKSFSDHLRTRCAPNIRLGWWTVRLLTLRWGKSERRVRNLFHSGSTKLRKRYPLI